MAGHRALAHPRTDPSPSTAWHRDIGGGWGCVAAGPVRGEGCCIGRGSVCTGGHPEADKCKMLPTPSPTPSQHPGSESV